MTRLRVFCGYRSDVLTAALALRYREAISLHWFTALPLRKDPDKIVDRIQLAIGQVTESEWLIVELIKTRGGREVAVITWPKEPTRVSPRKLGDTVARTCRVLANSGIEIAAHYGRKRW